MMTHDANRHGINLYSTVIHQSIKHMRSKRLLLYVDKCRTGSVETHCPTNN